MKDFKLCGGIIIGVWIVMIYIGVLPPFDSAVVRTGIFIMSLTAFILFIHGRMFKVSLAFLVISLILILSMLPNIKDLTIYFTKHYSTAYVKVENYYYHYGRGGCRDDECIVGTAAGSGQKITYRLPSGWYDDSNGLGDEMEGKEYKITYLPNTKQIINLEKKNSLYQKKVQIKMNELFFNIICWN